MRSKITGGPTEYIFTANILNKYPSKYFRCIETGFIQTEEPYWLEESYSSAITSLDLGLVMRNIKLANATEKIIGENLDPDGFFLDYAGGYGMFTRIMRDKGYKFYHSDKYCENLYATHFTSEDIQLKDKYEMVTAFEVFEHLANPLEDLDAILNLSDIVLFSTELVPKSNLKSADDWWYFAPGVGQHVSFYTVEALQFIAKKKNYHLYSNRANLHILSAAQLDPLIFKELKNPFSNFPIRRRPVLSTKNGSALNVLKFSYKKAKRHLYKLVKGKIVEERKSLLPEDFNYVKELIRKGQV